MAKKTKTLRFALIRYNTEGYALHVDNVLELINQPDYEPWVGEGEVVGYYNHDQKRIPLFKLGDLLDLEGRAGFLLVIKSGKSLYGLLVPKRPDMANIDQECILPLPDFLPEKGKRLLTGVITYRKKIYGVLNPQEILS